MLVHESRISFRASGDLSDYDVESLRLIEKRVAAEAGVGMSDVRARVRPASVLVDVTITTGGALAARAISEHLTARLSSAPAATAALGVPVESVPVVASASRTLISPLQPPPSPPPIAPSPPPPPPRSTILWTFEFWLYFVALPAGAIVMLLLLAAAVTYYRRYKRALRAMTVHPSPQLATSAAGVPMGQPVALRVGPRGSLPPVGIPVVQAVRAVTPAASQPVRGTNCQEPPPQQRPTTQRRPPYSSDRDGGPELACTRSTQAAGGTRVYRDTRSGRSVEWVPSESSES